MFRAAKTAVLSPWTVTLTSAESRPLSLARLGSSTIGKVMDLESLISDRLTLPRDISSSPSRSASAPETTIVPGSMSTWASSSVAPPPGSTLTVSLTSFVTTTGTTT